MNKLVPSLAVGTLTAKVFTTGIEIRSRGSWLEPSEAKALHKWLGEVLEESSLTDLVIEGFDVVNDFMPNIGKCALQDYGRLNHFLIEARKIKGEE